MLHHNIIYQALDLNRLIPHQLQLFYDTSTVAFALFYSCSSEILYIDGARAPSFFVNISTKLSRPTAREPFTKTAGFALRSASIFSTASFHVATISTGNPT